MSYSDGKSRHSAGVIPSVLIGIGDFLYMTAVTVMLSLFVYVVNNADFRWFMAFGAGIGCAAYHMSLGKLVMLVSGTVANAIRTAIRYAVVVPVVFAARLIRRCAAFVGRNTVCRLAGLIVRLGRLAKTAIIRKRFESDIRFSDF